MSVSDYVIDNGEFLRYLGYDGQEISPELFSDMERMKNLCLEKSKPAYISGIFKTKAVPEGVSLEGTGVILRGADIKKHLEGAKYCAVMAATLGLEIERALYTLENYDTPRGILLNATCTALIEAAADRCEEEIKREAAGMGLYTNYRYSPGYGDFPISQGEDILGVINAGLNLGITFLESGLMQPRKSVSAVIGLFPKEQGEKADKCAACPRRDTCALREDGGCGR